MTNLPGKIREQNRRDKAELKRQLRLERRKAKKQQQPVKPLPR
jgi:hypothetical protein